MQTCTVHAGWGPRRREGLAEEPARTVSMRLESKVTLSLHELQPFSLTPSQGKQLKLSFKHNKVVDGKKPEQSVSVKPVTLFPRECW